MPDGKKKLSEFNPEDIRISKPKTEEPSSFGQTFSEVYDKVQALGGLLNPVNAISTRIVEDELAGKKNYIMDEVLPVLTAPGQAFDEGLASLGVKVPWNESVQDKEYNPIAGGLKIIESMGHLVATPFTALDQALRHSGLVTEANIIAFPFEKAAEGYVAGENLIQSGLNKIPGYSVEKEYEAIRWALMEQGVSPDIAYSLDDEKLNEIGRNISSLGQMGAMFTVGGGIHKAVRLGKQATQKFKKPLLVKTDPYIEPTSPKMLPETTRDLKASETGSVTKTLTQQESVQLGELKLGRDQLSNERIYLQDKLKSNRDGLKDLKGKTGKEVIEKRKAFLKDNTETIKRIKEIDEIVEYTSKKIDGFMQGEVKGIKGLLPEKGTSTKLPDVGKGDLAPSNINFTVATEPGAKTTTKISPDKVLGVKRTPQDFMADSKIKLFPEKFEGKPVLDSGLLRDILKTAEEYGIKDRVLSTLRVEAMKRKMNKEFESAYKEALKEQPKQKADVKPVEPKQIANNDKGRYYYGDKNIPVETGKPVELTSERRGEPTTSTKLENPLVLRQTKEISGKHGIEDNVLDKGALLEEYTGLSIKQLEQKHGIKSDAYYDNLAKKVAEEGGYDGIVFDIEKGAGWTSGGWREFVKFDKKQGQPTIKDYQSLGDLVKEGDSKQITKFVEAKLGKDAFNKLNEKLEGEIKGKTTEEAARYVENRWLEEAQKIVENKPVEKKPGLGTSSQLGMGIDPTLIADAAKYGAELFGKGYKSFSKWADEMTKTYGNEISPQLVKLWDMSKVAVREVKEKEQKFVPEKIDFEVEAKKYQKVYEERHKPLTKSKESLEEIGGSMSKTLAQTLKPSDTRIKQIDPAIYRAVKLNDHIKEMKLRKEELIAEPLVKPKGKNLKKQLTPEDAAKLDLAFKQENEVKVREILGKHGVTKALDKNIELLKSIGKELGIEKEGFYWPRMVKNYEKYAEAAYKYLNKEPKIKGILDKILDERAARKGSKLTIEEQAHIIDNTIRGYNPGIRLSKFANEFNRMVKHVDANMAQYLHDWDNSLMMYLQEARIKIENRKLLGKQSGEIPEITDKSIGRLIAERKLESSKPLTMQELAELTQILKAGIEPTGVPAWANTAKDIGYATTLFNYFGSITQAGDIYAPLYRAPLTTLKVGGKMLVGKSSVSLKDIGVDVMQIGREFTNPRQRSQFTRFMAKTSLFRGMDMGMKTLAENVYYERYRNLALQDKLKKGHPDYARFELRFGDKANEVIQEFKNTPRGELTGRMAFQLWDELDAHQPISRWALPENYHKSGAMQLGYQMKTFALRRMDYLLNESVRVMKDKNLSKPERAQGIKNFFNLMTVILASEHATGLTKEFLKNLFKEGEFDLQKAYQDTFEDWDTHTNLLVDNMMGMVLLSRYDLKTIQKDGFLSALAEKILPVTGAVDNFSKDIIGGSFPKHTTRSVPLVGTAIYEWFLEESKGKGVFDLNFNIPSLPSL